MARRKGDGLGRIGGRAKGTPNKVTKEMRELISKFLDGHWDDFVDMYENADVDKKLDIYMGLMPYATPKMASVEYHEESKPKTFKDELDEISGEKTKEK